jgi:Asp-tRNA(Asn)/Glu-tRNA(Gln) amidotransferase A subunit family amidase
MTALHDLSAEALSSVYRSKELSPVEVTHAVLARIDAWEKKINAMYLVDAARRSPRRGRQRPAGAPAPAECTRRSAITIKDNIAVKGMPTPVGTAAGDLTPATADAPPSMRVREAGCVIIGKTTMPDFGMLASGVSSLHGITRNPWNLSRNSGGSSSGAGVSLVAGYTPLALGTDIGGSVRLPAAYNGVFALKPSLGRVPIYPPYLGRSSAR